MRPRATTTHREGLAPGGLVPGAVLTILLVLALLPAAAASPEPLRGAAVQETPGTVERRSLRAHRLDGGETVEVDGHVREPLWERADVAADFLQQEPLEGAPATEPSEVRVAYDERNLYIAAVLNDSRPEGILAHKRQRDAGLNTDDRFMWILDTFLDGRTAYFFEINPAGLMGDGLMGAGFNKSWDGIWEASVTRGPHGWSAEIRIPFSTLNFDPGLETWGINFQRTVRRKNEEALWEGHRVNQGLFNPTYAGRLTGLSGMSQGLGLEVRPYGLAGWQRTPASDDPTDFPLDAGVDLSYSFTAGLRSALTVNTDFAEVEVDRRRVNLTRFPLFFPEKRDFFLENSDVYNFAPANDQRPYFSRRIGLVGGERVPIDYGARLGGQAGPYELGFLQIRTGDHDLVPPEDFTVARVKRRILEASTIGAIYTRRATEGGEDGIAPPDRHTAGVDLLFFTSEFLGDRNLRAQAFLVAHSDPEREGTSTLGDRSSRGLRLSYPNDEWDGNVSYREFGDAFDPAVGFVARNGFRRLQPSLGYHPRPAGLDAIRQLHLEARFERLTSLSGLLLTRDLSFELPEIDFESGDRVGLGIGWNTERLQSPFEIHDGVVVPVGRYDNFEWRIGGETAARRRLAADLELGRGGFWSGERTRLEAGLTYRPATGLSARGEVVWNDVDLPEGAFVARVYRLIGEWHMSPWASLTQNVQYDDVSRVLGLQARLRWIVKPGSELFVVYTHNWRDERSVLPDPRLRTLSREAATKLVYTLTL